MQGPYNSQIVRRSWGILETSDPSSKVLAYGPDFNYNEYMTMKGPVSAFITSLSLLLGFTILGEPSHIISFASVEADSPHVPTNTALFSPARWALRKWGPQPGTGPSKEMQEKGWFKVATTAKSVDGKHETQMIMKGKGDPVRPTRSCFSSLAVTTRCSAFKLTTSPDSYLVTGLRRHGQDDQ